jgi:hypothetical protein
MGGQWRGANENGGRCRPALGVQAARREGRGCTLTFQQQKSGTRAGLKLRHHAGLADTSFDVQCGMLGAAVNADVVIGRTNNGGFRCARNFSVG